MIYVDSGFLIALFDSSDDGWLVAWGLYNAFVADQNIRLDCARDVMNELLAHYSRSGSRTRQEVARFVRRALNDPKYRIETVNTELYLDALDLYKNRHDKRYSMVDCIGMTIMRREGISEVVTTDRDFVQEGFLNLMGRTA